MPIGCERGLTELYFAADLGLLTMGTVLFPLLPLQGTDTDEQHWLSSTQSPTTGSEGTGAGMGLAFHIPQD